MKTISFLLLILSLGCQCQRPTNKVTELPHEFSLIKDKTFVTFFENFINDTIFQINHIEFPIEGGIGFCDSTETYTLKNWDYIDNNFLKKALDTDVFIIKEKDEIVKVVKNRPEMGILEEIKFKKINNIWILFYRFVNVC